MNEPVLPITASEQQVAPLVQEVPLQQPPVEEEGQLIGAPLEVIQNETEATIPVQAPEEMQQQVIQTALPIAAQAIPVPAEPVLEEALPSIDSHTALHLITSAQSGGEDDLVNLSAALRAS
jgi:hypothetical protein